MPNSCGLSRLFAQVETEKNGAGLASSAKDEFDAFLEGGIHLAYVFLHRRCVNCAHNKQLAFSYK
ncbi:MAG: hypothetical protein NMNS01_28010 [Nitrosomonas sp.]|nr:MAG: hypothetical protein NMNS01_28010 [Nitrosomonas sp.]